MDAMKPLNSRKSEELVELFERFNLTLPEPDVKGKVTRPRLIAALKEAGIDNKRLIEFEKKEQEESVKASNTFNGMAVVCMDRQNASFQFRRYKFTQDKKYVLMPETDASELISTVAGFRLASVQEVEGFYR